MQHESSEKPVPKVYASAVELAYAPGPGWRDGLVRVAAALAIGAGLVFGGYGIEQYGTTPDLVDASARDKVAIVAHEHHVEGAVNGVEDAFVATLGILLANALVPSRRQRPAQG